MKKIMALAIMIVFCLSVFALNAGAEESSTTEFNWDNYSLDELIEIQEGLSAKIKDLQRQWAIEHGDRAITIEGDDKPIYTGKALALTATVEKLLESAPDTTKLVWTSSDPSVATVNTSGTVSGVSKGTAVITCSAEDNDTVFAEKEIEVILPVTAVEMAEAKATALIVEGSDKNGIQLAAKVQPEDAFCQDLHWTSSNEAVASVDESGYVTAITPGTAVITATSPDEYSGGSKKAVCTLTVLQAASSVELDNTDLVLNLGAYQALKATVLPDNTSNKSVTWESSAPEVVTVSNGQLKAVGCGEATVTATAADGSGAYAECSVTVIQMVTSVKIAESANPIVLNKDGEMALTAVITPDNATNPDVAWSSSDESIVTISDDGVMYGENGGTAVVTCTAKDGSEKTVSVNVFVPTISVDATEITVDDKEGLNFPVKFFGQEGNFDITASNSGYFFTAYEDGKNEDGSLSIHINPIRYGKGTLTLADKSDSKNNRTITVNISHDAVYDATSYPTGDYTGIMRDPDKYDGSDISIYGRVLQKMEDTSYGLTYTVMRVATSGRWDNVFYVTSYGDTAKGIIEDDYITVYGECAGTESYKSTGGSTITIPSMQAEKIILGRG